MGRLQVQEEMERGRIVNQALSRKIKKYPPFAALLIILLVSYWLWVNLPEDHYISVYSHNSIWDLREFNFENAVASIHGRVDYIPAPFLSPEKFAAREDEISRIYPGSRENPATVRIRFVMPEDVYYVITRISTGYADRMYVNGRWIHDVGNPDDYADATLYSTIFTFAARPVNGVIEILHQQSNFTYHVRGVYQGGSLDIYEGNDYWRTAYTTNILLGLYLAIAMISLLMYLFLNNYRPALYLALLCIAWFVFTGAMGSRAFITIAPWYLDSLRIRLTFTVTPVTTILGVAILRDLFPNMLHRYFIRGVIAVMAAWTVYFIFADIAFILSVALWVCMGMAGAGAIYVLIIVALNFRRLNHPQIMFALGEAVMIYAAVRDIVFNIPMAVGRQVLLIPPFDGTFFLRIGVIIAIFCQFAAEFMAAMREMERAKEDERRLAADNAALDNLSRIKTEFLTNLSHDIKTPLAVVLGDIQRIGRETRKQGLENERISQSISRAQEEIMRMARLTERAIKMAALQESNEKMDMFDIESIFVTGAEGYRSIIEKQSNTLIINAENNLPQIYGNADQLIGVLSNLLTNANKHTKNGEIVVNIKMEKSPGEANERYISVAVMDNGAGIAPEIMPHVFERGMSGSGSTGMGLAICKNIVESHGGKIRIESEPGKGTTVTFTVQLYK